MPLTAENALATDRPGRRLRPSGWLLVAAAAIAALIAVGGLGAAGFVRTAQRAQCTANLHRLAQGVALYVSDWNTYPPAAPGGGVGGLGPYVARTRTYRSPHGGRPYLYNVYLSGVRPRPGGPALPLLADPAPDSSGVRHVVFTDGRVLILTDGEFLALKAAFQ